MTRTCDFAGRSDLSRGELFFRVAVDTAANHFGVHDIVEVAAVVAGQPILPTRGKLGGATRGTSVASSALARRQDVRPPFRLHQ